MSRFTHLAQAAALALAAPLAFAATPALAAQSADAAVMQLVRDFMAAESQYDSAKIASLITSDYAEVSPLGELDLHDAFLGFYAADQKRPTPATTVTEPLIRIYGDTASIILRIGFDIPGPSGQPPRAVSLRAGFLAVRQNGSWKLASAQFTPERPKAPPASPAAPAPTAPPKP